MPDQPRRSSYFSGPLRSPVRDASDGLENRRARRNGPGDWRHGRGAVRRWDLFVVATALLSAGCGVMGSVALSAANVAWARTISSGALWLGLAVAVVFAFTRGRPNGILKALPVDLLWGLGVGVGLRLLQGVSEGANSVAFPVVANLSGGIPPGWFFANVLPAAVVGPFVEEFFFRAVVLISVFQCLYRPVGAIAAALTGLLVSVGSFVLLHSLFDPLSLQAAVQLAVVGTACGTLVLLTGRIWAAVLAHSVYNISYLVLLAVGTMLS